MKKILIISYYYPPANFVGAERIASFARHLHKYGYYPIIVTRNWNENQTNTYEEILDNSFKHRVYDTHEEYYMPYNRSCRDKLFGKTCFFCTLLRRILTLIELFVSSFWIPALPYANLYTQARILLNEHKDIKALIISGSPFESFHFGYKLKQEFPHIHWIPDYRDEWTAFRRYPSSSFFEGLIFKLNSLLEKKFTSNINFFLSVSDDWVERISRYIAKNGLAIRNGYEPVSALNSNSPVESSKFILAYSGSVYPNQDFRPIAKVIARLIKAHADKISLEMQFFGAQNDEALNKIILASFRKENIACRIFSKLSLSELHRQLSKADFMFVTKYGDFNGFIPVKVFDYYNLGKPILNFPSDKGEIENFILSTNSGWAFSDGEDCYNALSMAIARKVNGEAIFNMNHRIDSSFYTREHQASILANHLNELISHVR